MDLIRQGGRRRGKGGLLAQLLGSEPPLGVEHHVATDRVVPLPADDRPVVVGARRFDEAHTQVGVHPQRRVVAGPGQVDVAGLAYTGWTTTPEVAASVSAADASNARLPLATCFRSR